MASLPRSLFLLLSVLKGDTALRCPINVPIPSLITPSQLRNIMKNSGKDDKDI
jgi:hypothetical protein